jgi:hypothetical protein
MMVQQHPLLLAPQTRMILMELEYLQGSSSSSSSRGS